MRLSRMVLVVSCIAFVVLAIGAFGCTGSGSSTDPATEEREQDLAEREAELQRRETEIALQEKEKELDRRAAELSQPKSAPTTSSTTKRASTPPPPPKPSYVTVRIPAGTDIDVEIVDPLSSGTSTVGDRFNGRLLQSLVVDGRNVAAAGAAVSGTVTEVVPLKKFGGQPKLTLLFDRLEVASGETVALTATLVQEGKKQAGKDAAVIGGSTAAGAVVGHQIDDDKGKLIGAVVGGAIGTAVAAQTGKDVEVPAGATLRVRIESPVEVRLQS